MPQILNLDIVSIKRGAIPRVYGVVAVVTGKETGHGLLAALVDFLVQHGVPPLSPVRGRIISEEHPAL